MNSDLNTFDTSGELVFETVKIDGTSYVREPDGTWRYADSGIKVPGAKDLTLTEHIKPKLILAGDQVERVVVSSGDIAREPELLQWVLDEGTPIHGPGGGITEVFVGIDAWRAHDRIPHSMVAPEHSDDPAERELALAERAFREAERDLERAAAARADVLRRHAREMTRQEARAITDLSVGRIQQLIRDENSEDTEKNILRVLAESGAGPFQEMVATVREMSGSQTPVVIIRQQINSLEKRGLVERDGQRRYRITEEGRVALYGAGPASEVAES